ncbi:hypothetical protein ZPR_2862 [Zunongwangia profunda SM-A87]|uniref:Uncharacterized protein n=1 Tax=Zunongwangia profunda (strain DSM 18752 / CCTCC AB 206139 / SM-A87) TaxID=655815 RepID=D5BG69_ZUNPS|nr:hypothetical protein ZPR_2862 [Zunongwangia profunda SM-A87]
MVSGNTIGTNFGVVYKRNFRMIETSKSLPASSPMYNQIAWSTKINIKMIKTVKNVCR